MNQEEFIKQYNLNKTKLFNAAFPLLLSRENTEDVLQMSLVKAWENIHRYDQNQNFINWMTTIVKNTAIDFGRSEKRKPEYKIEDFEADNLKNNISIDFKDKKIDLYSDLICKEKLSLLTDLINSLPFKYKEVFNLVVLQGLSFAEASNIMDQNGQKLSISAIRGRLYKARAILKERAESYPPLVGHL